MEHSALHAIQLVGLLLALGGPWLVLGMLRPALRKLEPSAERNGFAAALERSVARWVCYGALAAALGTLADFFVQAAELEGRTVFSGVQLSLVVRFASQTVVGHLGLARAGVLLLAAAVAGFVRKSRWWLLMVLAGAGVGLASLVSHAAAQPTARTAAIVTQVLHLCGGAVWLGVLMHWLFARRLLEGASAPGGIALTAEMVRRFSPWAVGAVSLLAMSGLISVYRFVGEPGALLTSAYGLTLLLKLLLLGLVLYAGYQNYGTNRPALLRTVEESCGSGRKLKFDSDSMAEQGKRQAVLRKFGRTLELEVTTGLLVITVAGILGSVSPPGQAGVQRLTVKQTQALIHPHLPRTAIASPATFYGLAQRTPEDLRYSEFTHNWSGVAVSLLGLCWLGQSLGGKRENWAARLWPGLLVVFGAFIGWASDPEVWWLRRVSWWQAVGDPQLLEHQVGAGMVFLLAALAWRNRRCPKAERLLGYALPAMMIFGSLLLLGHAHSTLNATDEVTSLINVQHAVFGTFGLLAGTVRWLSLRGLISTRVAARTWPSLVIGLGLFMTFYYREAI